MVIIGLVIFAIGVFIFAITPYIVEIQLKSIQGKIRIKRIKARSALRDTPYDAMKSPRKQPFKNCQPLIQVPTDLFESLQHR